MLQDFASIADIIGAFGVMISLVFVGLQVAQANKLARSAAQQKQIESVRDISRMMLENPVLADLYSRDQTRDLTTAERMAAVAFMTYAERTWEALYEQYRQGLVDDELWEAHRRQARTVQADPLNQAVWKLRKHWCSERYQKFRDADGADAAPGELSYELDIPKPSQPTAKA